MYVCLYVCMYVCMYVFTYCLWPRVYCLLPCWRLSVLVAPCSGPARQTNMSSQKTNMMMDLLVVLDERSRRNLSRISLTSIRL